jgi:hypothetical protein
VRAEAYAPNDRPAEERFQFACEEWERRAREVLSTAAFGYVAGGAGAEGTMRANREAFCRRLRPRVAHDVSERTLTVTVLGTPSPGPFLLAPIGAQGVLPVARRSRPDVGSAHPVTGTSPHLESGRERGGSDMTRAGQGLILHAC